MAVNVVSGIGFRIAFLLRLGERLLEADALVGHLGEDVVRRAVDDAHQLVDALGGEGHLQRTDDGDAAGDAGAVFQVHALLASLGAEGVALLGDQFLVGGDDVLAAPQGAPDIVARGIDAAHQLGDDLDFRVIQHRVHVGGVDVGWQRQTAILFRIAHADAGYLQRDA